MHGTARLRRNTKCETIYFGCGKSAQPNQEALHSMNSRERVIRTLTFDHPDRAPRHLWHLPGITMFRREEFDAFQARYPDDITGPPIRYGQSQRARGTPNVIGSYTDAWGCVWEVGEPGIVGEVKGPPLADWSALADYEPPYELCLLYTSPSPRD